MKKDPKIKSFYIKDEDFFNEVLEEVKYLWFKRYGESLTNSAAFVKSMIVLRETLSGAISADKVSRLDKYERFLDEIDFI